MTVLQLTTVIQNSRGQALWLVDVPYASVDDLVVALAAGPVVCDHLDTHHGGTDEGDGRRILVVHERRRCMITSGMVLAVDTPPQRVVEYEEVPKLEDHHGHD